MSGSWRDLHALTSPTHSATSPAAVTGGSRFFGRTTIVRSSSANLPTVWIRRLSCSTPSPCSTTFSPPGADATGQPFTIHAAAEPGLGSRVRLGERRADARGDGRQSACDRRREIRGGNRAASGDSAARKRSGPGFGLAVNDATHRTDRRDRRGALRRHADGPGTLPGLRGAAKFVAVELACRLTGMTQRAIGAHYGPSLPQA